MSYFKIRLHYMCSSYECVVWRSIAMQFDIFEQKRRGPVDAQAEEAAVIVFFHMCACTSTQESNINININRV